MESRYDCIPFLGPRPVRCVGDETGLVSVGSVYRAISCTLANRVLVVHARAGAGKTCFLSTGLIPSLVRDEGCDVLPIGRVAQLRGGPPSADVGNVYAFNLVANWASVTLCPSLMRSRSLARLTLADLLRRRDALAPVSYLSTPKVLVIDQFEELVTLYPRRWRDREGFFKQIGTALQEDDLLRVVLVICDDYLAALEPYRSLVPGGLRTRLHLEPAVPATVAPVAS